MELTELYRQIFNVNAPWSVTSVELQTDPAIYTRIVGEKEYELNDHLGNVRVVIADRKEGQSQAGQAPYIVELRAYNNWVFRK